MIGRKKEMARIAALMASNRSEFLAITGRRRVGKTFLVDTLLQDHYCFSMTGIQGGNTATQLVNFAVKLAEYQGATSAVSVSNWQAAFLHFKTYLKTIDKTKKHVIFIDELPWVYTAKSGFVQMLAHFWNDFLSKEPHFLLVVCGSATSWITQKVINDPGGLHNRVTENIHLHPFTLGETEAFLRSRSLSFTAQEVAKIYMALGGVPFYLERLRKGEGFAAAIERICFAPDGSLHNEYHNLFQALFTNAAMHQSIAAALADRPHGLTNNEILHAIGLKEPTGSYQRALEELMLSDFVSAYPPFGKKKRGTIYRLTDEYCVFYHRFIRPLRHYTPGVWQQLAESQSFKIWSGYAFETLCLKHVAAIKQALGIAAVYTEVYALQILPDADGTAGFQVDLVIDRKDGCINLCEVKFHSGAFVVTKADYSHLLALRQRFLAYSGTKKQVFITLITNHGIQANPYSQELVDAHVELADLLQWG